MSPRIVFIQGGGIGIDQEQALRRVLEAANVAVEWLRYEAGAAALTKGCDPLPADMLTAVRSCGVALKTKLLQPTEGDYPNFNVQLRRELGLFASVRPIRSQAGLPSRFADLDFVLVREITEDLYSAIEHEIVAGVVQSIKVVTETACRRFFRFTFQLARSQGRRSVHCIHKANILKQADGLFIDCFRDVAAEFPEIATREMIVDNCCMQLVTRPQQFEVLAAGNLYGDLLSDLGAGLVGGISTAFGINHGSGVRVYEAIHGGHHDGMRPGECNPLPLLFPAIALLREVGLAEAAQRIDAAISRVLQQGRIRTRDLGGTASTMEMADAIVQAL